ncbi:MAG: hypothetical protein ACKESB_01135 [Candidatus Hodgkinia cicadicola]
MTQKGRRVKGGWSEMWCEIEGERERESEWEREGVGSSPPAVPSSRLVSPFALPPSPNHLHQTPPETDGGGVKPFKINTDDLGGEEGGKTQRLPPLRLQKKIQ